MAITDSYDAIGGEIVGARHSRIKTFPSGRLCAHEGCRTVLSIYNTRKQCALHDFDATLVRAHKCEDKSAKTDISNNHGWHHAA